MERIEMNLEGWKNEWKEIVNWKVENEKEKRKTK